MSLDEFLLMLREWGKWSRGGIPQYRCRLKKSYRAQPMREPDVAQWRDSRLCLIKRHLDTQSFERYYVGGWSVSAIAVQLKRYSRAIDSEITAVERILYVDYMERVKDE